MPSYRIIHILEPDIPILYANWHLYRKLGSRLPEPPPLLLDSPQPLLAIRFSRPLASCMDGKPVGSHPRPVLDVPFPNSCPMEEHRKTFGT